MSASLISRALGAGSALMLALSLSATAQAAPPAEGSDLPTCSATITDHCMQRSGHHEAMMGHHRHGKHMGRHHGGHRHHHHHKHHDKGK